MYFNFVTDTIKSAKPAVLTFQFSNMEQLLNNVTTFEESDIQLFTLGKGGLNVSVTDYQGRRGEGGVMVYQYTRKLTPDAGYAPGSVTQLFFNFFG